MSGGHRITNLLLTCGAVAGPLFVAVFTVEGARREGHDPVREPVSALALGERGWTQRLNFVGTGALMLAYSGGLRRAMPDARWTPQLVAAFAVGLVRAGAFVTDPATAALPTRTEPSAADRDAASLMAGGVPVLEARQILRRVLGAGRGAGRARWPRRTSIRIEMRAVCELILHRRDAPGAFRPAAAAPPAASTGTIG